MTDMKKVTNVVGGVVKKLFESATHAAVFAFVSKKVGDYLDREKEKGKVRVESSPSITEADTASSREI